MLRLVCGAALALGLAGTCSRAAAQPSLPAQLTIKQWIGADNWTWKLTRRGAGSTYDARARHVASGRESDHTFTLRSFDGKTVILERFDGGSKIGAYAGIVGADGVTVNGTVNFAGGGWSMRLDGGGDTMKLDPCASLTATASSRLASRLEIRQWIGSDTWTWTLTRRGSGDTYDARARHGGTGRESNHTFTLRSFDGKTVIFDRFDGDYKVGAYTGTVASGATVNGTVNFAGGGWSMPLRLDSEVQLSNPCPEPAGNTASLARLRMVQVIGSDRWYWTLTRRGSSERFDAEATNAASGQKSSHTFTLRSFDGKTMVFDRFDGDYKVGAYTGTVTADGVTVHGTVNFAGGSWTLRLDGNAP